MSISIHIQTDSTLPGSDEYQVEQALRAIGFVRKTDESWSIRANREDAADAKAAVAAYSEFVEKGGTPLDEVASELSISSGNSINKPDVARKRGEPAPGKTRRTKAEIAEDEAADKTDAERGAAATEAGIQADSADDVKLAISTGDERINPEEEAQDAADEAAEVEANRKGLTHDDLRQAVGRYQKKFGMAAAVSGIPALLGCAIVDVPEADLAAAIAKVDNAVAGDAPGPVEDVAPVAAKPAEKAATKEDVMAAMLRYAKKFDGQDKDMNAMPNTMADAPKIFGLLFGESVVKLSQVPVEGYAKTVAAFDEAIAKDPFKRGAK